MRLGTIRSKAASDWRPAAFLDNDHVVDLKAAAHGGVLEEVLANAHYDLSWLALVNHDRIKALVQAADPLHVSAFDVGPPVPQPGKMIACGRNYLDHVAEGQKIWAKRGKVVEKPAFPTAFAKFASAITHHDAAIRIPAGITDVDYEVELAVVIGAEAYCVPVERALAYVAGYTICNDVATRPIQFMEMEQQIGIVMAKNLPTFAPMGPWMVTADDIPDPQALKIGLNVNGEVRQSAQTKDMLFSVAELVSYWSRIGLQVGDVILTGTPAGVATARPDDEKARYFLKDGDMVEAWISSIGTLQNSVKACP